jgi:hypothetical protein
VTVQRTFPTGTDTVELLTDGEGMTAHCIACYPPVVIGRWEEHVMLNLLLVAMFDHQDHVIEAKNQPTKESP